MSALIVIAKAPRAGRVKTRLCPPCTPAQAAALARAALEDTLEAVAATPVARRVVALDGPAGPWLPPGFELVPQRGDGLAQRLAAAFADVGEPAFLVGMDTPQVTPAMLTAGLAALDRADAVLGPAPDGGYWAIGLRRPDLRTAGLPALCDVDTIADARTVAEAAPSTRFAAELAAVLPVEAAA